MDLVGNALSLSTRRVAVAAPQAMHDIQYLNTTGLVLVDDQGNAVAIGGGSGITQLTGDVIAGPGSGSVPTTLAGTFVTTTAVNAPTNNVNLGLLASGLMRVSVAAAVATITSVATVNNALAYGNGTTSLAFDSQVRHLTTGSLVIGAGASGLSAGTFRVGIVTTGTQRALFSIEAYGTVSTAGATPEIRLYNDAGVAAPFGSIAFGDTASALVPNGLLIQVSDAGSTAGGDILFYSPVAAISGGKMFEIRKDGRVEYWNTSAAVSTAGTAAIRANTNKLQYSENGGAWANFTDLVGSGITALTGDGTATGPGSAALTLATVNASPGTYANATVTVNAKGLVTLAAAGAVGGNISGTLVAGRVTYATGVNAIATDADLTYDSTTNILTAGTWSNAVTAVTPGSYTYASLTVDSFGRLTAASNGTTPAPVNATYIVQTANGTLTNEQALGALGTGVMSSTTTTGVVATTTFGTGQIAYGAGSILASEAAFAYDAATNTLSVDSLTVGNILARTDTTYGLGDVTHQWAVAYIAQVIGNAGSHILTLQNDASPETIIALTGSQIDITGNIIPIADATYDIGSSSKVWTNTWSGAVHTTLMKGYGGSSVLIEDSTAVGRFEVAAANNISTGHLIPAADDVYTLGNSSHTWSVLWVTTIGKSGALGTITMLTGASGGLEFDSNSTGHFQVTHQNTNGRFFSDATGIAFFQNPGGAPVGVAQQTVTGSRGGNAALASLLTKLASYGIIIDSSS